MSNYPPGSNTKDAPWNRPERIYAHCYYVEDLMEDEEKPNRFYYDLVREFEGNGEGYTFCQARDFARNLDSASARVTHLGERGEIVVDWEASK